MWWQNIEYRNKQNRDIKNIENVSPVFNVVICNFTELPLIVSENLLLKHVLPHTGELFCVPRWLYIYACLVENIFNSLLSRSVRLLCYVWNERRPSLAVPSADSRESRSLCGSQGGTKTFPLEELRVPVDKEGDIASPGCVYMLVYSGDLWSSRGLHFPKNKWWLWK